MKQILFSAAFIAACVLTVSSCSNDNVLTPEATQGDKPALLDVSTSIEVTSRSQTGKPVNSFISGDEIGLFVSSGSINSPYNSIASNKNVKSAFTTVWTQATPVYLSSVMATIYAYYPYNASATDGTAVDIDHTSQTDYMYATPVTNINNRQPKAAITMNHALSLVQFDFKKENYTGVGSLTAITIANKTGGTDKLQKVLQRNLLPRQQTCRRLLEHGTKVPFQKCWSFRLPLQLLPVISFSHLLSMDRYITGMCLLEPHGNKARRILTL